MRRRGQASIVANPILVGAVTTLVVVVAVFLAYNANNGLPFVPTTELKVQVSNGANLVAGNEVRSGGYRVGVVDDMVPVKLPSGDVGAELTLKLDQSIGRVPVDSTVVIRPRSALGLKYVEVTEGRSRRMLEDGATLPADQARIPVELDEFYNMFDAPTRRNSQITLEGFGNAFAGRGPALNETVQRAPRLLEHLRRVAANLADPRTNLKDLFRELGDAARVVAPVSRTNAHLFTTMADTFSAIARDRRALQATISKSPPTLDAAIASLKVQQPFLTRVAAFSRDLEGATAELKPALPPLNRALAIGAPVQRRSVALNDELQAALGELATLTEAPTTIGALRGLTATVDTLQPQLRYLGPYVTVCNSWNAFWTFTAEHFSAPELTGSAERALLNSATRTGDGINAAGANEFAHGAESGIKEYLHNNTFGGTAITDDGRANCQAGQQGYLWAGNKHAPDQKTYGRAVVDSRAEPTDALLGPTYKTYDKQGKGHGLNPDRVPEGETFTSQPGGKGINP
jgi:virulence factor Mce-like protein